MAGRGGNSPQGARKREYMETARENREERLRRQNATDNERRADNAAASRREAERAERAEAARERERQRRTNVPAVTGTREVTAPGGGGGSSTPTGSRAMVPSGGSVPATSGAGAIASQADSMPPLRPGTSTLAGIAGGAARAAARMNPAASLVGSLAGTPVARATLPGQSYGMPTGAIESSAPEPAPRREEEPETLVRAPSRPAPRRAPRRAASDDGEADKLNEMSLRAIRREPASDDPRDRNIRRAMGMKKGGAVGKECYAKGGAVGKSRGDGCVKTGRTKARFI